MRNAITPAAGETVEVEIPRHRELVNVKITHPDMDAPFFAPFAADTVHVESKRENTEQSVAKTVRPVRRGVA